MRQESVYPGENVPIEDITIRGIEIGTAFVEGLWIGVGVNPETTIAKALLEAIQILMSMSPLSLSFGWVIPLLEVVGVVLFLGSLASSYFSRKIAGAVSFLGVFISAIFLPIYPEPATFSLIFSVLIAEHAPEITIAEVRRAISRVY